MNLHGYVSTVYNGSSIILPLYLHLLQTEVGTIDNRTNYFVNSISDWLVELKWSNGTLRIKQSSANTNYSVARFSFCTHYRAIDYTNGSNRHHMHCWEIDASGTTLECVPIAVDRTCVCVSVLGFYNNCSFCFLFLFLTFDLRVEPSKCKLLQMVLN